MAPQTDESPDLQADDFAPTLVRWQRLHGRHDLPWQNGDAYGVWVSEIMLQQTQVQTVIGYYARFMARFPTLAALAAADEGSVMESWSGLGYYARARNLHRAAREVMQRFDGRFPAAVDDITSLPGIGRSTGAAIATFCFGAHEPILDGNVKRVFARVFGIEGFPGARAVEQQMWALARGLMPACNGAAYTQALMDLGATVCTRGRPRCADCPLRDRCVARRDTRQRELPAPRPAKVRPQRLRFALLIECAGRVLLERRPGQGIWGGLLSLPELAAQTLPDALVEAGRWLASHGLSDHAVEAMSPVVHGFTHFELHLVPLHVSMGNSAAPLLAAETALHWQPLDGATEAALPAPIRKLLAQRDACHRTPRGLP
ncbi:A/G-specific adenine glycosylase [Methyloversatilis sp. RAC08]|uniref:A/G-specific adenine glycosylase n=1 Tax=Methyloversatilis sp. RAC08 TaxID=1842540 RepID=UPI00083D682A|nr:A/G-specific adenine glycosylase [Methyloversatilis sp. RAC08]AOF81723.1 A/G-specific adenine glycosylase [Methyloversatilis sp. RAC08]